MFYPTRYYTRAVIVARMCCQKREGHDKSGEIKDYEIVGSYFRQNVIHTLNYAYSNVWQTIL